VKALREAAILVLVACFPAALAVFFHPQLAARDRAGLEADAVRLEGVRAWGSEVLWVDARSDAEFARGSVPEAVHLAPERFATDLGAVLAAWRPGARVVVFCSSISCATSKDIARQLREAGLEDVYHLHGGWEAWQEALQP